MRRRRRPIGLLPFSVPALICWGVFITGTLDAAELRTVDGEVVECEWIGASNTTITVAPKDAPQAIRDVELADVDRLTVVPTSLNAFYVPSKEPFIDNDGPHSMRMSKEGRIKLRAGLHRIVIPFIQGPEASGLDVLLTLEGKWSRPLAGPLLYHVPDGGAEPASPGVDEQGFRLPENPERVEQQIRYAYYTYDAPAHPGYLTNVKHLAELDLKSSGLAPHVGVGMADREERFGVLFIGYVKIDEDGEYGFHLNSDDGCQIYFGPTPDFLLKNNPLSPAASGDWRVTLAGGGALAGTIDSWDGNGLTMNLKPGQESVGLTVPVSRIVGVTRPMTDERMKALDTSAASADADTVFVATESGPAQRVSGVVLGIDGDALLFRFEDRERRINLAKIAAITLAAPASDAPTLELYQELRLTGGQMIPGKLVVAGDGRVQFDTAWGQRVDLPMDQVESLRTRNGRLVYLSDMTPAAVEQTPYFDRVVPYRNDASLNGGPIKLFGEDAIHERGVCTHSRSVLRYTLGKQFAEFKATIGLLDPLGEKGDVNVRVLGDGRVLFERGSLKASDGPVPLELDVTGVDALVIETDFGAGQDVGDRVGWADARVIRASGSP